PVAEFEPAATFNPEDIQGRLVADEKASAEAGTLVGDIVPNGPQANQEAPGTAEGDWKDVKPLGPIFDTSPDAPPAIDPENIPDLGPFPPVLALVKVKTDDDLAVYQLFQEGVRLKEFAQARVITPYRLRISSKHFLRLYQT
ncbi:MAG: hypothetical protein PHP07_08520, partial [Eubacteriales bacterium]|nr:hypothetical protein [Eubacteriales bacterium]